jgi:hypothetical protein
MVKKLSSSSLDVPTLPGLAPREARRSRGFFKVGKDTAVGRNLRARSRAGVRPEVARHPGPWCRRRARHGVAIGTFTPPGKAMMTQRPRRKPAGGAARGAQCHHSHPPTRRASRPGSGRDPGARLAQLAAEAVSMECRLRFGSRSDSGASGGLRFSFPASVRSGRKRATTKSGSTRRGRPPRGELCVVVASRSNPRPAAAERPRAFSRA